MLRFRCIASDEKDKNDCSCLEKFRSVGSIIVKSSDSLIAQKRFMTTISFGFFVFGSIGVSPQVVGFLKAQRIRIACLMLMVVFLVCFSEIERFVFPKKIFFLVYCFHLTVYLVACNATLSLYCK